MNTKYSLRLLIAFIFAFSAGMPSHAADNKNVQLLSYQLNSDSNNQNFQSASCGSGQCGPESHELMADNSSHSLSKTAHVNGSDQIDSEEEESTYALFGYAMGEITTKNLAVAFFCLMSGALFLLFGLKGW